MTWPAPFSPPRPRHLRQEFGQPRKRLPATLKGTKFSPTSIFITRRRLYERMKRLPLGYLIIGDAFCSFNLIDSQGMSVAATEEKSLDRCLQNRSRPSRRLFLPGGPQGHRHSVVDRGGTSVFRGSKARGLRVPPDEPMCRTCSRRANQHAEQQQDP